MDIETALITAVRCLIRGFRYSDGSTGLGSDWNTQYEVVGLQWDCKNLRSIQHYSYTVWMIMNCRRLVHLCHGWLIWIDCHESVTTRGPMKTYNKDKPTLAVGTLLASFANLADFPRIWTCFFLELRVACFWACVNWNLLDFWACFLQISVLRIAIFRFLALLLFQCTAKCILGAFLWKYAHFGLVYSDLPPWFFIWFSCWFFSFCWSFLPTHLGFFFA